MSRPDLSPDVVTAVGQSHVDRFPLIHCAFDAEDGGDIYIAGTDFDIVYDGHTYLASRGLVSIEAITETTDEITGLKFTLAAVTNALVAEALLVKYQGRPCTVLLAFRDADGAMQVDELAWQGRLDVPEITRGATTRTITVTAEHRMADWGRARRLLFNDADQRRIDPTDTFLLGCEQMKEKTIVLFSKEVMRLAQRA